MVATPEVKNLGNAKDFSKEWNSDEYKKFRQEHISGRIPAFCKSCYKG